jgi:hypothetical protein
MNPMPKEKIVGDIYTRYAKYWTQLEVDINSMKYLVGLIFADAKAKTKEQSNAANQ